MDTLGMTEASCNAQRLLQKTSGPFNSGCTDVTHCVTSDLSEMTRDISALTPSKDNILLDSPQPAVHSPLDLPDFTDLDMFDASSEFLEHFTDLSTLFNVEPIEAADPAPAAIDTAVEDHISESVVSTASSVTEVAETLKRKRTSSGNIPPDHNGYTVPKTKRARVSSCTTMCDVHPDSHMETELEAPPHSKEAKYKERRHKNNIASRRSRETRKQKFNGMESKATELEASNAALRVRVAELEALARDMKEILVQRMVAK